MKTFFITTAIDYTNAAPHIGHAYEKILADAIARYHRLMGRPVYFLTGVDQHGQKVQQVAEKNGLDPQTYADQVTAKFLELWKKLEVSYDGWAATTDSLHKRVVGEILSDLHDRGLLYKAKHSGYYSVRQEQFLTDKERNTEGAFGPEWGEVVFIEEENWYFKLGEFRDWLSAFVSNRKDFVLPAFRQTELANAIGKGAGDLCISRPKHRLAWGIEFPFDPEYVTYVWFDALINYVSFSGYRGDAEHFSQRWPADLHVIGKDILVPAHGVYWPCMLKAMGFSDAEMPTLLVHGWWNRDNEKISKSAGNIVDPNALSDRFGVAALRYYLLRDIATGRDANFSEERLVSIYNSELANGLGNLLNRTLNMTQRYLGGTFTAPALTEPDAVTLAEENAQAVERYHEQMRQFLPHLAIEEVVGIANRANGFAEAAAPWKLAKDPEAKARLEQVLAAMFASVRLAATLLQPIIPDRVEKIFLQLGIGPVSFDHPADSLPPVGHQIGQPEPVFPRLELTPP